ncbi:MAG: hypothetical protein ABH828_05670 [archaeon]
MNLPEHKKFHGVHGIKAETLPELKHMIISMSDSNFNYHTDGRNDFALWIRDILHMDYLANRIEKVHSKKDTLELIEDELGAERDIMSESEEFRRFIVKEFMLGLLFGLIIGVVIIQLI